MKDIYRITEKLNLDDRILKLLRNETSYPLHINDFHALETYWYPHPPCLVPLFLGHGAFYHGVIKHFFCERQPTFAEYILEDGYISEIARDAEQFTTLMLLKIIMNKDGLTDEIIHFCHSIDFEGYDEIDRFIVDYGDDPNEFEHLTCFKNEKPFKHIKNLDEYNGDFPSSLCILNTNLHLQNACSLEIAPVEKLNSIEHIPSWLIESKNQKELFSHYLSRNELREAWLTLNSKNWLLKDVASGLDLFKSKTDDDLFHMVADNWIAGWKNSNFSNSNY